MLCFIENNSQNLDAKFDSQEQLPSQVTCVRQISAFFLLLRIMCVQVHTQRPEDSFGVVPWEGYSFPLRQAKWVGLRGQKFSILASWALGLQAWATTLRLLCVLGIEPLPNPNSRGTLSTVWSSMLAFFLLHLSCPPPPWHLPSHPCCHSLKVSLKLNYFLLSDSR